MISQIVKLRCISASSTHKKEIEMFLGSFVFVLAWYTREMLLILLQDKIGTVNMK